jgi:hypothetical protein
MGEAHTMKRMLDGLLSGGDVERLMARLLGRQDGIEAKNGMHFLWLLVIRDVVVILAWLVVLFWSGHQLWRIIAALAGTTT